MPKTGHESAPLSIPMTGLDDILKPRVIPDPDTNLLHLNLFSGTSKQQFPPLETMS
jgi:hypothetical protein